MNQTQTIGKRGEQIARSYLQSIGYKIHSCNVRMRRDETDIIAYDPIDKVIVFVELKARSTDHRDFIPELGMSHRKMRNILRGARAWIANKQYDHGYRLDLVCVIGTRVVRHYKQINA